MRNIVHGAVDQSVIVRFVDSTDGTPETAVTSATAGLAFWYRRELGGKTAIGSISDLAALTTAHTDGGMLHISDGYYRLDSPDAAFASGQQGVMFGGSATGMIVIGCYIPLVAVNNQDAVRMGLTALPNANAEAAGGLYTRGTGAGQINQPSNGVIDSNAVQISGDSVAADNAESFFDGTGYAGTNNVIPTVTTTATATAVTTVNGIANAAVDNILDRAMSAELASIPSQTIPTVRQMLQFVYTYWRNKYTVTTTQAKVFKADGSTVLDTAAVSDDGTTFTRGAGA